MKYKPVTYTSFADHLVKVEKDKQKEKEKEAKRRARRGPCSASGRDSMETNQPGTKPAKKSSACDGAAAEECAADMVVAVDEPDEELADVARNRISDYSHAPFDFQTNNSLVLDSANNPFLQNK